MDIALSGGCSSIPRRREQVRVDARGFDSAPQSTVHEWGRRGVLPRVKPGRHVRFIRAHVERTILDADQ